MRRQASFFSVTCALVWIAVPASAGGIDDLKGQFAFDWAMGADKTTCAAVDDSLLKLFKSEKYACNLDIVTNTASEEPARVCTEKGDGVEYLIFATKESCEKERETQASNSE